MSTIETTVRDRWITFRSRRAATPFEPRIGPWKPTTARALVAELPILPDDEVELASEWLREALENDRLAAVDPELVRAVTPPRVLTVECGGRVHQGTVDVAADRASIGFRLSRMPERISTRRRRWLRRVLGEAQGLRMVRVEIDAGWIHLRSDLSGAPEPLVETLAVTAAAALCRAVAWVADGITVLTDPESNLTAADRVSPPNSVRERD